MRNFGILAMLSVFLALPAVADAGGFCGGVAVNSFGGYGFTNSVFVQRQFVPVVQRQVFVQQQPVFAGGASVNIVNQRGGLFGRRNTQVIQANAGGGFGGANVNIVNSGRRGFFR